MFQPLLRFATDEDGQDLIEYSLLITFIAIFCMAFLGSGHPAISKIWATTDCNLATAANVANGG